MSFGNRFLRFALAMGVVGTISAQVPMSGGTAMADDGYGGGGGHNRQLIQGAVLALVGIGVYQTVAGNGANLPPQGPTPDTTTPAGGVGTSNVTTPAFDVLSGNDDLTTFATTAAAAGLAETLRSTGPYTVFAPTNAAFAALSGTTLADLQKPENQAQLKSLLQYHIVQGKYTIAELKALPNVTTAAGSPLTTLAGAQVTITYSETDNVLKINGVPIVQSDIPASNGVIHPIGQVLTAPAAATPAPATP